MHRRIFLFLAAATMLVALFMIGCGSDDDPVTPAPTTGTIIVDPTPEGLDAPWNLAGPDGYTLDGTGDITLTDMAIGSYSLTWGNIDGFVSPEPNPTTATLAAGSTITFRGTYSLISNPTGTVVVDPTPDDLDAPWSLAGPDGYALDDTGDLTLTDMAIGNYTLTWETVNGYVVPSPNPEAATLEEDGTVTFSGTYSVAPDPLEGYVLIPPASVPMPVTFTMGSLVEGDETPHEVTLTGRFDMAETEITNGQYVAALQWAYDQEPPLVTATTTSVLDALDGSTAELLDLDGTQSLISFSGDVFSTSFPDRPVAEVSWYGAVAYCDWLSLQAGLTRAYDHSTWGFNGGNPYDATGFRLPTEAEWELACRAGTTTNFNTGACLDAGTEANYHGGFPYTGCPAGQFLGHTADVGSYPANDWELYEMHGNVDEWCNDWYGDYSGDETDPEGVGSGSNRVVRGGYWETRARYCRSAFRLGNAPPSTAYHFGFRPVKSAD